MPTEKPPGLICGRCATTCEHSNQRMVKFTQQNGPLAYHRQCLTCGHGQGASRTRISRTRTRSVARRSVAQGTSQALRLVRDVKGTELHHWAPRARISRGSWADNNSVHQPDGFRVDLARLSLGRRRWTARDQLIRVRAGYSINCRLRCRPPGLAIEDQQGNHEQRPGNQRAPFRTVRTSSWWPEALDVDCALSCMCDECQQHAAASAVEQPGTRR